ncbi:MAG: hypothetical protein KDK23_00740 [Leptospiraceae bacterium]|nr:hypothetical protein [Leptospiraceae bacterium]
MRQSCLLLSALVSFLLSISVSQAQSVEIPAGLQQGKPGTYDLLVQYSEFNEAKSGVRIMVYVPGSVPASDLSDRPAIVFFHGNTKQRNYYRDSVGYMTSRAEQYGFLLLSVQNWWSLGSGDVQGADDSRRATNLVLHRLKKHSLFDPERVFPVGFSAGGFTANLVFVKSLNQFEEDSISLYAEQMEEVSEDEVVEHYYRFTGGLEMNLFDYAGFGSFKGNYYQGYVQMNPFVEDSQKTWNRLLRDKVLYIAVGELDVERVKKQAPEMADFIRMYAKVEPFFKIYPGEGHALTEANWKDFWALVEKTG